MYHCNTLVGQVSSKRVHTMRQGSTLVCDAVSGPQHCQVEDSCRPIHVWPSRAALKGQRPSAKRQSLHGQSHAPGQAALKVSGQSLPCGLAALAQGWVGRMQAQDGLVMSGSTSPLSMSSHALSPLSSSPRLSSGVRHPRSQPSRSFWHALCNQLLHACCAFLCVPLTQLALT